MRQRKDISEVSRDLALRAEAFCAYFFPNGYKQGNYWQIGDTTGAKGKSLAVRLRNLGDRKAGSWTDYATGEYGDLIDLLHANLGSRTLGETLRTARRFLGEIGEPIVRQHATVIDQRPPTPTNARHSQGRKLFSLGKPISGTLAFWYLSGRGIRRFGPALRFHPTVFLRRDDDDGGDPEKHPALLAKITDNERRITGCARTFLDRANGKLSRIESPKRVLGQLHGNAVRLFGSGDREDLIVGEGLENTLSVGTSLPEYDLASCLTANHLALFNPPSHVKRIWIARDSDEVGERAAIKLRQRLEPDGFAIGDLVPCLDDFNNDLLKRGRDALRHQLLESMRKEALPGGPV